MRKIGCMILSLVCLWGCQFQKEAEEIHLSKAYKVNEDVEFEIIKTKVSQQIAPSNKNKSYKYIKTQNESYLFIDMIVNTMNLSQEEKKLTDVFSGHYQVNGQSYDIKTAVETTNYNQITTTDTLKTNEGRYVHLYCEVLKDEIKDDASVELKILNDQVYQYTFSTEQTVENNNTKSVGDILTLKQSQITIQHLSQSTKVEPSDKGFFYSYFPTDHDDETFVIVQIDLKNQTNAALNPEEYLYCEYQVDDQSIKSMIVIESENHQSISKTGHIEPSQSRTLYLAMAVKNELLKKEGMIHLFVEGRVFEMKYYNV